MNSAATFAIHRYRAGGSYQDTSVAFRPYYFKSGVTWFWSMYSAHTLGCRLPAAAELVCIRRQAATAAYAKNGMREWTGTVLDYRNGAADGRLLENVVLGIDGSIRSARCLGKRNGINLPPGPVRVHMLTYGSPYLELVRHLWGTEWPLREMPRDAYLDIAPSGLQPVVIGVSPFHLSAAVDSDCCRFMASLVKDIRPTTRRL